MKRLFLLPLTFVSATLAAAPPIDSQRALITAFSQKNFGDGALQQENLEFALLARAEFSWARETPIDIFLNDVLPPNHIDEAPASWRPELYRLCAPLVKNAPSRREAIRALSEKFPALTGVAYSTARRAPNQSCAETLQSKVASCSGLSILLASAFRSVGIPARLVGVGEWSDRLGNHTWLEVWDDDGWHATEFYPDPKGLDHGWFYEPLAHLQSASATHKVVARTLSKSDATFFLAWDMENKNYLGVDRTAAYAKRAQELFPQSDAKNFLILEAKDSMKIRVPVSYRWILAEKVVKSGTTPSPTDDANAAPRLPRQPNQTYRIEWHDPQGILHTETISPDSPQHHQLLVPTPLPEKATQLRP